MPVSRWSGEGNAADSVGSNPGTLMGGMGFAQGKVGQAFEVSPVKAVGIPQSKSLVASSYSVEAWVRPDPNLAQDQQFLIFGQASGEAQLLLLDQHGRLFPKFSFGASDTVSFPFVLSSNAIPRGSWSHLMGTWDSTTTNLSIWVNGLRMGQSSPTKGSYASGQQFYIGGFGLFGPTYGQYFSGVIDEVAFYDRALSQSEVQARYLSQDLIAPHQVIAFEGIPNHFVTDPPFLPPAFASSGLPVTFEIVSGPATVVSGQIAVNGLGTVVVRATQNGNAEYDPAAPVVVSFEVLPDLPPVIQLTSPASGSVFNVGQPIVFQVEASDPEGKVAKVEFFDGDKFLVQLQAAPFKFEVSTLAVGVHSITAKVTDGSGKVVVTSPVTVKVSALNDPTDPFGRWTLRHEKPGAAADQHRKIIKLVIGNGLFVALQSWPNNSVVHSSDELRWLPADASLPSTIRDVAFGHGLFVAVGGYDKIFTSTDATTWTPRAVPEATNGLVKCSYANGLFICVGSGSVFTSSDGSSWQRRPLTDVGPPGNIIYGNGIYLSIDAFANVFTSTNLTQWTAAGASSGGPAIFAKGMFVSPYARSLDGLHWTPSTSFNGLRSIAYAESSDTLVAVGTRLFSLGSTDYTLPLLATSTDGVNWTLRPALFPGGLDFIAAGDGRLMAGGVYDAFDGRSATGISEDGIAWRHGEAAEPNLNAVASGPAGFVAVGNNGLLLHSANGSEWAEVSGLPNHHLFNVCQANGTYVAVGEAGLILVSQNGRDWTRKATGTSLNLYGVTYGAGKFVVVGGFFQLPFTLVALTNGSVSLYSTDGSQWTTGSTDAFSWLALSVAWDGKRFVVSGMTSGFGIKPGPGVWLYESTNGVSDWVQVNMATQPNPSFPVSDARRLKYGNGRIAFGSDFGFGVLTDLGLNPATYLRAASAAPSALGFGNGLFVAVAGTNAWTSADGLAWRSYELPTTVSINDVAYSDGAYVVVGANQTIIQSSIPLDPGIRLAAPSSTGAGHSITVPSQTGLLYFLEVKDSLSDPSWQPLPLVPGTGSPLLLQDNSPPTATRFYRVRVE